MPVRVKDITAVMETYFPLYLAESWDNVGLQIGSVNKVIERVVIALDVDERILEYAIKQKADMIISHHPLLFKPLNNICYDLMTGKLIRDIVLSHIAIYCAHTNLDAADKGLNQLLAELLGIKNIEPLDTYKSEGLYKLVIYVPAAYVNEVRAAVNKAGAGYTGNYSDCSFRVQGTGTFCPGPNTEPYIGTMGNLQEVDEYRLETVVYRNDLPRILRVMQEVHPYEEIAYDIYPLINEGKTYSIGRKGFLEEKMSLKEYSLEVKKRLGIERIRVVGELDREIEKIAVVCGSGASFINKVIDQGIDLLVTGDLKYHEAKEAEAQDLSIIDAGHQETEKIVIPYLCNLLADECRARDMQIELIEAYPAACFKTL